MIMTLRWIYRDGFFFFYKPTVREGQGRERILRHTIVTAKILRYLTSAVLVRIINFTIILKYYVYDCIFITYFRYTYCILFFVFIRIGLQKYIGMTIPKCLKLLWITIQQVYLTSSVLQYCNIINVIVCFNRCIIVTLLWAVQGSQ